MSSITEYIIQNQLASPPSFIHSNIHYETEMGSVSYGTSTDSSDLDIYGFCIPPKDIIFPHLAGVIGGFGNQGRKFDQWQQHHIKDKGSNKIFDVVIYNIVKYFQLCMECNPNMIDSMFTPLRCHRHITKVGQMVLAKRHLFLSKKSWVTFHGYSISQLHKAESKNHLGLKEIVEFEEINKIPHSVSLNNIKEEHEIRERGLKGEILNNLTDNELLNYHTLYLKMLSLSSRAEKVKFMGIDSKFLSHVVRLLNEVRQILMDGDLILDREDCREHIKAVRRGEVSLKEVREWFQSQEVDLERLYNTSDKVPHKPDEDAIKQLLIDCLEEHYGNLSEVVIMPDRNIQVLREIKILVDGVVK